MDIIDFFNDDILELPKQRFDGDFEDYLQNIFDAYLAWASQLTGNNRVVQGVNATMPQITALCQEVRAAVAAYLEGFPHGAYEHLSRGIQAIRPHLDHLASK